MPEALSKRLRRLEGQAGKLVESREGSDDLSRWSPYAGRPVAFIREVLGGEPWGAQEAIARDTVDHPRVLVHSGHSVGKDWISAQLLLYAVYALGALVLVTGPTARQVRRIVFQEVARAFHRSTLPGQLFQTALRVGETSHAGALGFTSGEASKMTGFHAPVVWAILTEAQAVEDFAFTAMAANLTGEDDRLLAVGNPTVQSGPFYQAARNPTWRAHQVSCLEHPNVVQGETVVPGGPTRAWVEARRREWGKDSGRYRARVLGEFAAEEGTNLVKRAWLDRAQEHHAMVQEYREAHCLPDLPEALRPDGPLRVGLDIARLGGDTSVLCFRRGGYVEEFVRLPRFQDTMKTTGNVIRALRERGLTRDSPGYAIYADEIGVGGGVVDRLRELGWPCLGINVSAEPLPRHRHSHLNLRASLYWTVRDRLDAGTLALPPDEMLAEDLLAHQHFPTSSGKTQVEEKKAVRQRLGRSPDLSDALVLTFATGTSATQGGAGGVTI